MGTIDSLLKKVLEHLPVACTLIKNGEVLYANSSLTLLTDPGEILSIIQSASVENHVVHRLANSVYIVNKVELDDAYSLVFLSKSAEFDLAYDDLTGALDRECLQNVATRLLEGASLQRKLLGFLFLDLDGFKLVNDNWGHEAGDLVLKKTTERIAYTIRKNDYCFRLGGDEFLIILTDLKDRMHSCLIARRLLVTISEPVSLESMGETGVGASIGISCYPSDGNRVEELIHKADEAMYRAKKAGKNTYQLYQ